MAFPQELTGREQKLTEAEVANVIPLHRGFYPAGDEFPERGMDCPPCHGRCHQGRQCPAIAPTATAPRIVPCSTVARIYLGLRAWWRG